MVNLFFSRDRGVAGAAGVCGSPSGPTDGSAGELPYITRRGL